MWQVTKIRQITEKLSTTNGDHLNSSWPKWMCEERMSQTKILPMKHTTMSLYSQQEISVILIVQMVIPVKVILNRFLHWDNSTDFLTKVNITFSFRIKTHWLSVPSEVWNHLQITLLQTTALFWDTMLCMVVIPY